MTDARRSVLESENAYGKGWPIIALPYGTPYNTQNVDDPPTSWDGFLKSKWEDRLATPPLNHRSFYVLMDERGWEQDEVEAYLVDLDDNIAEYPAAALPVIHGIIAGQYDVGFNVPTHYVREGIDAGGITMPPFPSFYQDMRDLDDMVFRTVARMLELLDIEIEIDEWTGISP